MLYLIAVLFPPLAVLLTGRFGSFLLNCLLTLLMWVPGVVHAMLVVHDAQTDKRNRELIRELKQNP